MQTLICDTQVTKVVCKAMQTLSESWSDKASGVAALYTSVRDKLRVWRLKTILNEGLNLNVLNDWA